MAVLHARATIALAPPPSVPCNRSRLPGARESLQAFGQSMHCQGKAAYRRLGLHSSSFFVSLRSSIASAQTAGKKRSEFGSRSSEARHHCASRTAQNTRDFLVGQLSVLSEHNDLAKLFGKLLDRFSYLLALHFAHIKSMRIFGRFDSGLRSALVHIELDDLGRGTPLSQLIEPDVS